MTTFELERIRATVVKVLHANVGFGEGSVNNSGPLIDAMGGRPGDEWCALLGGYVWRRAYVLSGFHEPSWCYRRPGVLEVGAKALAKAMAREPRGVLFVDPAQCLPGDFAVWHRRTGLISWKGHLGTVVERPDEDLLIATIEGNVGKRAKVRLFHHDVSKERFAFFAGLR